MNATRDDAIRLNCTKIGQVKVFIYLGTKMSITGDNEVEIRALFSKEHLEKQDHQHKDQDSYLQVQC